MENFYKITTASELSKIFEMAQEKLVMLMFFSKHNPDCKRAINSFEKSAVNHNLSLFCVVDMDKFQGESRYVANVTNMPKFEIFHLGNSLASQITSNEKDIENIVRTGEQYVMTQSNMKNNNINQQGISGQMPQTPLMPQIPQIQLNPMQIQQIQQQILNNAQMQNPTNYQYLMQNPMVLQNLVQRQIQQMQMSQMPQQNIQQMPLPQQNQFPQMPGQFMQANSQIQPTSTIPPITQTIPNNLNNSTNMVIPTMQQMQQMFQIFQMMQQMGILNMNPTQSNQILNDNDHDQTETSPKISNQNSTDETIILPNGDKIIPLGNGKYGLVKKNS